MRDAARECAASNAAKSRSEAPARLLSSGPTDSAADNAAGAVAAASNAASSGVAGESAGMPSDAAACATQQRAADPTDSNTLRSGSAARGAESRAAQLASLRRLTASPTSTAAASPNTGAGGEDCSEPDGAAADVARSKTSLAAIAMLGHSSPVREAAPDQAAIAGGGAEEPERGLP